MTFEEFKAKLNEVNYEYFVWMKSNGHLPIGKTLQSLNVFVPLHNEEGEFVGWKEPKISFDTNLGIVIE